MEEITVRGKKLKVDIRSELEHYDWGYRAKWQEDKLIAPSPFRYDKSPSFFVNLTGEYAGTWKDSGYEDPDWASGGFVKLLSFLRGETINETEFYLLDLYAIETQYDTLELGNPNLTLIPKRTRLPADWLAQYPYRHGYLTGRGISPKVQKMMRVRYDKDSRAIVIPWLNSKKEIVNAKYRSVSSKIFWYAKDAYPIKWSLYGMDVIYATKASRAVICEAEIDAMSFMTWGLPAIATGNSSFSETQADLIRRSPIKELVIGTDNDSQGLKLRAQIIAQLQGHVELFDVALPLGYKDANEALQAGKTYGEITPIQPFYGKKLQF